MPRPRSSLTIGTTLAVVLLLLAIFLRPVLDQFRQRGTMAAIERIGCRCAWEWAPNRPAWIFSRMSDARKHWGDWIIGATFRDFSFQQHDLESMKALPYLRRLELFISSVSRDSVAAIEGFERLEGLGIHGDFRNPSIRICRCPHLIYLSLNTPGDVEILDLPQLEELILRDGDWSRRTQQVQMSGLPKLRTIAVTENSRLLDEGVFTMRDLPALESIYLNTVPLQAVKLSGMPKLRELDIRASQLNDAGISTLSGLHALEALRLVDCDVTDAGLAKLDDLPLLEILDLRNTYVTLKGLAGLGRFPRLREVVTDCPLTTYEHHQLQQVLPGVIITSAPTRSFAPTRSLR